MICRLWSLRLSLIFLFLFLGTAVQAQNYPDPSAEAHAWTLHRAYKSGDSYTFEQQVRSNPTLTKKSFLFVMTYFGQQLEVNPTAAEEALYFAFELATYIESYLGDPVPNEILEAATEQNLQRVEQLTTSYTSSLYQGVAQSQPQTTTQTTNYSSGAAPFSSTGGSDPAAREHAYKLYQAMQAQDAPTFQALFGQNPTLTKKAFLSVIEHMLTTYQNNPNADLTGSAEFAAALAEAIKQYLSDPVPAQIVQQIIAGDNGAEQTMTAYIATLYPATTTGGASAQNSGSEDYIFYGDNKEKASNYPAEKFALMRPLLMKLTRTAMAITYKDARLTLQELDTFSTVMDNFKKSVRAETGEITPEFQAWTEQVAVTISLARLEALAEFGLLNEFGSEAQELMKKEEDANNRAGIYFTGFRVAFRQQQFDQAQSYLEKGRAAIAESPEEVSPVFGFLADTGEYQLQVARQGAPTPEQTTQAFRRAWAHLDNYQPLKRMTHDTAWYYGRSGLRYWIEQLSALGKAGEPGVETILASAMSWLQAVTSYDISIIQTRDDALLHAHEMQGYFTMFFTTIDAVLNVVEFGPEVMAEVDTAEFLKTIGQTIQLGALMDESFDLSLNQPGFPPFALKNSSEMKKLAVRMKYLEGLNPKSPSAQRATTLQALLPMLEGLDSPDDYISYHLRVGYALKDLGRSDLAITAWEKALKKAEALSFVSQSAEAAALLAEEYGKTNDWQKASALASKANEGMQQELGTSDETVGLEMAKKTQNLTQLGAVAAIKSNDPKKALALLSEGQQMNSAAVQLSGNSEGAKATKELQVKKKQVATLTSKVEELKQMPESATRDEMIQKAETLLAETKSDFLTQSRNIRQKYSNLYTTTLRFDPLNLPDVQAALPDGTAVVQYFATEDELYIFVVTKTDFRLRSLQEKKQNLDKNIFAYLKEVQKPGVNDAKMDQLSTTLYQTLVAPIEKDLASSKTVVLIPSGRLNVLPFGALKGPDGKLFIEEKTLLELAKPTDFMKIASTKPQPVTSVIAFANATMDLPAAEQEGERIMEIFPDSRLFKREEASKANLIKFGSDAQVLHLATHGTWDASNSLNNYLKLSNGQKLAQEEIFNLNLAETSIVTLSACSTALADNNEVDYVASLAEAFWIAGSRSVVASLWPVDDSSTGLLMTNFYERLKAGDGKAEALRKAQLAVRQDPRFAHPYFWSGFILFGDYR